MSKCIDLSHQISNDMPVFPGTEQPGINSIASIANAGYNEMQLIITTHTGTHIDMPAHMVQSDITTDTDQLNMFYGSAIVIHCDPNKGIINLLDFKDIIEGNKEVNFVLFHTGWDIFWGEKQYFFSFPVLTEAASKYLVNLPNLKGIGFDCISIDPVDSEKCINHNIFLHQNKIIIENLTNLENINQKFTFACFPLKIKKGDGSPVRAVAIL